jgi:hypothetical protein
MQGSQYNDPALAQHPLPDGQCGETLAVSESLLVLACPENKKLTIFRRSNMEVLFEKDFTGEETYAKQVELLDREQGKLTYVFYSIEPAQRN